MSERLCSKCDFWERWSSDELLGFCRRYAPRAKVADQNIEIDDYTLWPTTPSDSWCGEFQPK